MTWLFELHKTQPVAHAIGALAFVCVLGMALGSLKFRGIGLGTAGVLFAGIVVGHFGNPVDQHTLHFVKEFGLMLFVFAMGLQLGPGFSAALRHQGVKLNLLRPQLSLSSARPAPRSSARSRDSTWRRCSGFTRRRRHNMPSLGAASQTLSTIPEHRAGSPRIARSRLRRCLPDGNRRHHRGAAFTQTIVPRLIPCARPQLSRRRTARRSIHWSAARSW